MCTAKAQLWHDTQMHNIQESCNTCIRSLFSIKAFFWFSSALMRSSLALRPPSSSSILAWYSYSANYNVNLKISSSFYTFLPTRHSLPIFLASTFKVYKANFRESAEKISLISFFSFELELQLTKICHTSHPLFFFSVFVAYVIRNVSSASSCFIYVKRGV